MLKKDQFNLATLLKFRALPRSLRAPLSLFLLASFFIAFSKPAIFMEDNCRYARTRADAIDFPLNFRTIIESAALHLISNEKNFFPSDTSTSFFPVSSEFAARAEISRNFTPIRCNLFHAISLPNSKLSRCYIRSDRYVLNFAFIALITYMAPDGS